MLLRYGLLLPMTVAVGVYGTRTAVHLRRAKGSRRDVWLLLALAWSPLLSWATALLLSLSARNP